MALSGDFYRSSEALIMADTWRCEGPECDGNGAHRGDRVCRLPPFDSRPNTNHVDYELPTTGHTRGSSWKLPSLLGGDPDAPSSPHGELREGEHVESGAPRRQASFFELADANSAHFSTENIDLNWIPKHTLALDHARNAWSFRDLGPPNVDQSGEAPSMRAGNSKPGDVPDRELTAAAMPGRPDPAEHDGVRRGVRMVRQTG